jgi:predicted naringenin-chalcone synthase
VGLSQDIPDLIRAHTPPFVDTLLSHIPPQHRHQTQPARGSGALSAPLPATDAVPFPVDFAVHPGGRSILEGLQEACDVPAARLRHSWDVLRRCGNMSSATVWFVLDSLRRDASRAEWAVALAFGPGLAIEGCLLRVCAPLPSDAAVDERLHV